MIINKTFYINNKLSKLINKRIKDREQIISILLETFKEIQYIHSEDLNLGFFEVYQDKNMSRINYITSNRIFSIHLPFKIRKEELGYQIFDSKIDILLDYKIIQTLQKFNERGWFNEKITSIDFLQMLDEFDEIISEPELDKVIEKVPSLIFKLNSYEIGYIRFDNDPKLENENMHPLYHLDINYLDSSTYKIGLDKEIVSEELFDIFNSQTPCYFLNKK